MPPKQVLSQIMLNLLWPYKPGLIRAEKKTSRTLSGPVICTSSRHALAQRNSPGKLQQQSCAS